MILGQKPTKSTTRKRSLSNEIIECDEENENTPPTKSKQSKQIDESSK